MHVELMLHLMNSDGNYPYDWLPSVVQTLINEVRVEKLMWGSDMPACERTCTYRQGISIYQKHCDLLGEGQ